MKISLYPFAQKWKEQGTIWFYSDPHFGDSEMVNLRSNYISDEEQIRRINSRVGKNDTIIFLGDIGNIEWIRLVRGYKILIKGNHDKGNHNYQRRIGFIRSGILVEEDNRLFNEIYDGALCISEKIILSHEPIYIPFMFNIHGHDHSNQSFQDELHWNMCAENIDYTPISLNEIIKSGKVGNIDSIHRITIDKANNK